MRKAARAIILHEGKILVMHRNKFGKEYYTLPGGNVEVGETPEEAVRRELKEEACLDLGEARLVFVEEAGDPYGTQYIFLCEYLGGEPRLAAHSEEAKLNKLGKNIHTPMWLSVEEVPSRPFVSEKLKQHIVHAIETKFPDDAQIFRTA